MSERSDHLRQQILQLTTEFHAEAFPRRDFVPGTSTVPVSGKVIDAADVCAVVDSALDGWFTTGRWAKEFERKLARFVGVRSASLVNSGSSANLVALSALTRLLQTEIHRHGAALHTLLATVERPLTGSVLLVVQRVATGKAMAGYIAGAVVIGLSTVYSFVGHKHVTFRKSKAA